MKLLRRLSLASELARVLLALPAIESARRTRGPARFLGRLRRRGARARRRDAAARERLRVAIRWVDARVPGGANCYRRALLEIALDPDAARTPLVLGLAAAGGEASGHAWLEGSEPARPHDVVIRI